MPRIITQKLVKKAADTNKHMIVASAVAHNTVECSMDLLFQCRCLRNADDSTSMWTKMTVFFACICVRWFVTFCTVFFPWLFPHSCIRQKQQKSNYFNAVRSFMHSNHTTRWNLFMECTAYAYKHYGCFMQTFIVFIVYQFVGTLANFLICSSKNCAVSTHRIVGVFLIYVLRSFLCTDH